MNAKDYHLTVWQHLFQSKSSDYKKNKSLVSEI